MTLKEWLESKTCCCRHPDARTCLVLRSDPFPDDYPDSGERCECCCHDRDEEDDDGW